MTTTRKPATTTAETNVIEDAGDEEPTEVPQTEKPTQKPRPAEKPKPVVVHKPTAKPVQNPVAKPVQNPVEKPVEIPAEQPTIKPDETEVEDTEAAAIDCTNQDFIPSTVDCRKVSNQID